MSEYLETAIAYIAYIAYIYENNIYEWKTKIIIHNDFYLD
jgi:hypothetical protein